jgi:hypothetical protein
VADQRVGEAHEHARLLGHFTSGLGGMRAVIDAGTENFFRVRDGRQPLDGVKRVIGLCCLGELAYLSKGPGCEGLT